jgi:hypothetical protein
MTILSRLRFLATMTVKPVVGWEDPKVQLNDPFPVERCSARVKAAILAEFCGRSPTVREVMGISDAKWLSLPGVGRVTLMQLQHVIQGVLSKSKERPLETWTDAALVSRRVRLRHDIERLRSDLQAITSELLLRGSVLETKDSNPGTGLSASEREEEESRAT